MCSVSFTCIAGLDAEAAAELEAIRGNLAKYKGKMGKEFEDIAINEMDWVRIMHSTGRFKKNAQMFVCLISPEPMNGFQNLFFLLKTELHM